MPNHRAKPGETPEQARLRYNAEMREYRKALAQQGRPLPNGSYDFARDKSSRMKRDFGITLDEAQALLDKQGGRCAICDRELQLGLQQPKDGTEAHVDHCPSTGRIRGILCGRCNKGLGLFLDNPAALRKAADYLG